VTEFVEGYYEHLYGVSIVCKAGSNGG